MNNIQISVLLSRLPIQRTERERSPFKRTQRERRGKQRNEKQTREENLYLFQAALVMRFISHDSSISRRIIYS